MFDLIQYPSSSNSCIFPFLEQGFPSVVSGNICLAAEVHKKNVLYFLFFVIFFLVGPLGVALLFFCFIDILATVLYHLYIFMSKRVYHDLKVTIQKTFHKNKHKSNNMYNENKHWMLFFNSLVLLHTRLYRQFNIVRYLRNKELFFKYHEVIKYGLG